jgi:glycerol-3-phosphate O-acyltransferase
LFTVLRLREQKLSRDALARAVLELRDELGQRERSGELVLADQLRGVSGGDIVSQAMRAFSGYHSSVVIEPQADGIVLRDPKLLLYYQNRLARHGLAFDPEGPTPRAPLAARGGSA